MIHFPGSYASQTSPKEPMAFRLSVYFQAVLKIGLSPEDRRVFRGPNDCADARCIRPEHVVGDFGRVCQRKIEM